MTSYTKPLLLSYNKQTLSYTDIIAVINWIRAKQVALQAWATGKTYTISSSLTLSWDLKVPMVNGTLNITWSKTSGDFTAADFQELDTWVITNIENNLPTGGILKRNLESWVP